MNYKSSLLTAHTHSIRQGVPMKQLGKPSEGNPLAKWEAGSQWVNLGLKIAIALLIVMLDGDRNPCANIMFVLECMWRSQAVSFDDLKVMNWDRGSVFIGYDGCDDPHPVVIY